MPRDTSLDKTHIINENSGVNGAMKQVRLNAETLKQNAQEFEAMTKTLKKSKFYTKMKALQDSIIN